MLPRLDVFRPPKRAVRPRQALAGGDPHAHAPSAPCAPWRRGWLRACAMGSAPARLVLAGTRALLPAEVSRGGDNVTSFGGSASFGRKRRAGVSLAFAPAPVLARRRHGTRLAPGAILPAPVAPSRRRWRANGAVWVRSRPRSGSLRKNLRRIGAVSRSPTPEPLPLCWYGDTAPAGRHRRQPHPTRRNPRRILPSVQPHGMLLPLPAEFLPCPALFPGPRCRRRASGAGTATPRRYGDIGAGTTVPVLARDQRWKWRGAGAGDALPVRHRPA
jgi:hypothetical protein